MATATKVSFGSCVCPPKRKATAFCRDPCGGRAGDRSGQQRGLPGSSRLPRRPRRRRRASAVNLETTRAFDADYRKLNEGRAGVRCLRLRSGDSMAAIAARPARAGTPGILKMTWVFVRPGGRARFELVTVAYELRCRWRRVGDHDVVSPSSLWPATFERLNGPPEIRWRIVC